MFDGKRKMVNIYQVSVNVFTALANLVLEGGGNQILKVEKIIEQLVTKQSTKGLLRVLPDPAPGLAFLS